MTFKIEQFVSKIKAPIVCRIDDEELSFADGEELAAHTFDNYYFIDTVEIEDGKAVLTLTARTAPAISSVGDELVTTEDWIKEQKELYDTVPNLFDGV